MSVTNQTPINRYAANGVTTVFPYTFLILAAADIKVTVDGVTKTLTTDYTVSGAGTPSGGNVTFLVAPASGTTVVVKRNMAYKRDTDYQDNGDLLADTLNPDQDAPVLMLQQVAAAVSLALRAPDTDSASLNMELPVAASRALKYLGFDISGNATVLDGSGTTTDSQLVTFLPDGTGAANTTVQAQLRTYTGTGAGTYNATNMASGISALASSTSGGYNIAIGYEALKLNDVGEQNTAIGYKALTNAKNYLNPFYPVPDPDPANEYLETSGNVAIGFEAGKAIQGGNYNVAIGHTALGVVTSPAAGVWGPAQGSGNIAIGSAAMAKNYTGEQNVAIGGGGVLEYNSSGSNNVAIGWMAMLGDSVNSSVGGGNVAVGAQAMKAQQNGGNNVAVGSDALLALTTGDSNVAVGHNTLKTITTATGNTAVGEGAGAAVSSGAYNTAVGYGALGTGTTTGSSNTAVGTDALKLNTTSNNTAVGTEAGAAVTSGTDCVFVGYRAGKSITGGDCTIIGSGAGGSGTGAGNTIIGKGAAANLVAGAYNVVIGTGAGNEAAVFNLTNESGRVILGESGISNFYCKVALTVTSDARDKTDFRAVPYGLDFVNELAPVAYRWDDRYRYFDEVKDANGNATFVEQVKDGSRAGEEYHLGFKAQDVIALEKKYGATNCMIGDEEQADKLKITETKMIPVLVKALQELSQQVALLQAEMLTLKEAAK